MNGRLALAFAAALALGCAAAPPAQALAPYGDPAYAYAPLVPGAWPAAYAPYPGFPYADAQGPYAQTQYSPVPYPPGPYTTNSFPPSQPNTSPPWPASDAPPAPSAEPSAGGAAKAVAFALGKVGAPYCWGGTGPTCFDCSGLTRAAWLSGGKSIPRTSEQQASALPPVPLDRIRPGDIAWRPGHVGIYVGRGLVVSATKTGDVVRAQPLSGYRKAVRP